jgi:WD40 repeat protein
MQKFDNADDGFLELVEDSTRFYTEFRDPISASATHVYYSAIPFTPRDTVLFRTYSPQLERHLVNIPLGISEMWTACRAVLEYDDHVTYAEFSPDGSMLATGSKDSTIRFWDTKTGASLGEPLRGHAFPITFLRFSPSGNWIASRDDGTVRLWELEGGKFSCRLSTRTPTQLRVAISPDCSRTVSNREDHSLSIRDGNTGEPCCFSLRRQNFTDLERTDWFTDRPWVRVTEKTIVSFVFSSDGTRAVSRTQWAPILVHIWDMKNRVIIASNVTPGLAGQRWYRHPQFSNSNKRLLCQTSRNHLQLRDSITGALEPIGQRLHHTGYISFFSYSPDGRFIASTDGLAIYLWHGLTGVALGQAMELHGGARHRLVGFSPDGETVFSKGADKSLGLWDTKGLAASKVETKHSARITYMCFSPGGEHIISGSTEGRLQFWDARSGGSTYCAIGSTQFCRSLYLIHNRRNSN